MSSPWRNTQHLLTFLSHIAVTLWFILIVLIIPLFKVLEWVNREPHDTRTQQLALQRLDHMKRVGNYSEEFFAWMNYSLGSGGLLDREKVSSRVVFF